MKTLLLIPSFVKRDTDAAVAADRHPRMDYNALVDRLRARPGDTADIIDYRSVDQSRHPLVRLAAKVAGRDAALAALGWLRCRKYQAVFTNGENIALPLALLFKLMPQRPTHVTIGHRVSTGKKRLLYSLLHADRQMDTLFIYSSAQYSFAHRSLGIPQEKLRLIPFHADQQFYRSRPADIVREHQICSAGLEWRDYPTLLAAVSELPSLLVKLAAASPWSKHANETEGRSLPPHVDARRYDYADLRELYAQSAFVVVPLRETDFQAGITTILEAMSMGRAVIATRTAGQGDVIQEGVNGLYVEPGDVDGMREAILRLINDPALCDRLAENGRRWVEQNATLDIWTAHIAQALYGDRLAKPEERHFDALSDDLAVETMG